MIRMADYARAVAEAEASVALRQLRADNGGRLPAVTNLGGYTIIYVTFDGAIVCASCAEDVDTSDPVEGWQTYDEGPNLACEDCGDVLTSSYGDPEAEAEAIAFEHYRAAAQYAADAWHRGTLAQLALAGAELSRRTAMAAGWHALSGHVTRADVAEMAWHYDAQLRAERVTRDRRR